MLGSNGSSTLSRVNLHEIRLPVKCMNKTVVHEDLIDSREVYTSSPCMFASAFDFVVDRTSFILTECTL